MCEERVYGIEFSLPKSARDPADHHGIVMAFESLADRTSWISGGAERGAVGERVLLKYEILADRRVIQRYRLAGMPPSWQVAPVSGRHVRPRRDQRRAA